MKNHYNYNTGDCLSAHLSDCCVLCPTYTLQSLTGEDTRTERGGLSTSQCCGDLAAGDTTISFTSSSPCVARLSDLTLSQYQQSTTHISPVLESSQHPPGSISCPLLLIGLYWNDSLTQQYLAINYNTFDRKSIFRIQFCRPQRTELHWQCFSVSPPFPFPRVDWLEKELWQ